MSPRVLAATGALLGLLAVATGAFGAHLLSSRLPPDRLATWELAARYQMVHALALLAAAWAATLWPGTRITLAGALFLFGTAVFCGTLYALALGAPRWLGMVTPIGGVSLMAGWLMLAWAAWAGA